VKLRKVKPGEIKVPELRVRARFDQELMIQFKNSIKETGIVAPVIVCQVNEDLVLVDGEHRLQEALENNLPMVDVVVFDGDMVDVLTKNLFLDQMRGKTPVSEMVEVIGALYSEYNLDPDQIRAKTGLTRDYIEKLVRISTASSSIQQALDDGVIGVGHAFELSRLPYAIQQEEVMAKHQVWRFTIKELHEQIDQVLKEMEGIAEIPPPAPQSGPGPARVFYCEGCKEATDPRYMRPVMLCPNCFGEVWRLAKARVPAPEEKIEGAGGD